MSLTTRPTTTAPPREPLDPRLAPPRWDAAAVLPRRLWLLIAMNVALAVFYFGWLLQPQRIGSPVLYTLLVVAECFNLVQAAGFWWTIARARPRRRRRWRELAPAVDVLVPVYGEPVGIVEPTIAAATRLRGADVTVWLLDDGDDPAMADLAARHGARYLTRARHTGAKAGNINHALRHTGAPFVLVLDCDHVPSPEFLEATLGWMEDEQVAFVQTPQYYANADRHPVAAASWAQQALFFGAIARGKDARGAMFCAGTNVLFRRRALVEAGGFPEDSLTEDFALSVALHERGWRSAYVPEVLAQGLGPEDMASYVGQQQRWARGCLAGMGPVLRARLPLGVRVQYLLSSAYFLTGWTVLIYMSFPVIRILTGEQPLAGASADAFLIHFAPYFAGALLTVAVAGAGSYTFAGFALAAASAWIGIQATVLTLLRRRGRFVVTPKEGVDGPQPRAVVPALVAMAALASVAVLGLARDRSPATVNNVAFASLHLCVLAAGVAPALRLATGARAWRVLPAVAGAAAAVAVGALALGRVAPAPTPGGGERAAAPDTAALRAGMHFLHTYVDRDGRVVRRDQGGDTVSEGQAYAMLVAAGIGDRATFDRVWNWTRLHLLRSDGLLASRWLDGTVADPNAATDADLDAARALGIAAARWHRPGAAAAARRIGHEVLADETADGGRTLLAGSWAAARRIADPSYVDPRDLRVLDNLTGDPRWRRLAASSRTQLDALTRRGLAPDWVRVVPDGTMVPIGHPGRESEPPVAGFDAVRVPIRLATSCAPADRRIAARAWPLLRRGGNLAAIPRSLDGTPVGTIRHPVALVGAAAAASAAGDRAAARHLLDAAERLDARSPSYYGAAWVALGRLGLETGGLGGC